MKFHGKLTRSNVINCVCIIISVCCVICMVSEKGVSHDVKAITLPDNDLVFDAPGVQKSIMYKVEPTDADTEFVNIISTDSKVVSVKGDDLIAVSAGEAEIYAVSDKVESNRVKVIVKALEELPQEEVIIAEETEEKTDIQEAETTPEPEETEVKNEEAVPQPVAEDTSEISSQTQSDMVYIGKTGTKYHYQNCKTLKGNGRPITMAEAIAQGRESCKVCKR